MQHAATHDQPQSVAPAVRIALAVAVSPVLAGVVGVATSASYGTVRHMAAQLQDNKRYVKLPRVEIVGRRAVAMGLREGTPASPSATASAAGAGCVQPS